MWVPWASWLWPPRHLPEAIARSQQGQDSSLVKEPLAAYQETWSESWPTSTSFVTLGLSFSHSGHP